VFFCCSKNENQKPERPDVLNVHPVFPFQQKEKHEHGNQSQTREQKARPTIRPRHGQKPGAQVHARGRGILHPVRSQLEGIHSQ
jgi:hypothetical protein